jgi:hypothetical protein
MAVRPREIGWGNKEILIWELTKEVERLTTVASKSNTTSTSTTVPSDIRLKKSISLTGEKIGILNEYTWEWNDKAILLGLNCFPTKGVIAQEVLGVFPEAISIAEDGYLRVDYNLIKQ